MAARPVLQAIYDLGCAPVTFDWMNFLAMARLWAARGGFAGYHVTIALGDGDAGFRRRTPKDVAMDDDEKLWRLRHILMAHEPIARDCQGLTVVRRRDEFVRLLRSIPTGHLFPPAYDADAPKALFLLRQFFAMQPSAEETVAFEPTASALRRAREWLETRGLARPVTLTLRGSPHEDWRNSRVEEWLAAADHIRGRGLDPVIVPDHDLATAGRGAFGAHHVYLPGALDLDLRVAMYALAGLNMAHNGGPAFLAFFMTAPMVCFLPVDALPAVAPDLGRMATLLGVPPGGQFPYASPRRRLVWEPADRDTIVEAFEQATGPSAP